MVQDGDLNVRCRGINRVGVQNVSHGLGKEVEELSCPREDDVFVRDESEPVSEEEDVIDSPPNEGRQGASLIIPNHTLVPQTAFQRERTVRFADQLHRHGGIVEHIGLRPAARFLPHSRRCAVFGRVFNVIVGDDIFTVTENVQPDPVPTVRRKVGVFVNGVLHSLDAGLPVGVPHRKGEVRIARNLENRPLAIDRETAAASLNQRLEVRRNLVSTVGCRAVGVACRDGIVRDAEGDGVLVTLNATLHPHDSFVGSILRFFRLVHSDLDGLVEDERVVRHGDSREVLTRV